MTARGPLAPHTPGPWARNISPKYPVYAEVDHRKVAVALTGHGVGEAEAMSNLVLIAAAPTLRLAVEYLLPRAHRHLCDREALDKIQKLVELLPPSPPPVTRE